MVIWLRHDFSYTTLQISMGNNNKYTCVYCWRCGIYLIIFLFWYFLSSSLNILIFYCPEKSHSVLSIVLDNQNGITRPIFIFVRHEHFFLNGSKLSMRSGHEVDVYILGSLMICEWWYWVYMIFIQLIYFLSHYQENTQWVG